jgi:DNA-binding transcriptional regulator YdaS (Cro superfamily)
MTLQEYFVGKERGSKALMAMSLGISRTWLSLVITNRELPSAELAVAIEKYTKGKVKRKVLRPDIFAV